MRVWDGRESAEAAVGEGAEAVAAHGDGEVRGGGCAVDEGEAVVLVHQVRELCYVIDDTSDTRGVREDPDFVFTMRIVFEFAPQNGFIGASL